MAKKITNAQATGIVFLVLIGLVVYAVWYVFEAFGYVIPVAIVVIAIILYILYKRSQKKRRLTYLREKYQDEDIVQNIFNGYFWQGQTAEQLVDSLGNPVALDKKVLKTKKKEIWKYGHQGGNRYNLRITLEDDVVIGWEKKD